MATLFAERYELKHRLGAGVFGEVYAGWDSHLKREVAVKLLKRGLPKNEAFQEAQVLVELAGDHVLPVFDADTYGDIPYIVTRVAKEGTVQARAFPLGVTPAVAIRWICQSLSGLDGCHDRGVIHRDVKPSNIFLDADDHVRIGDFGVAGHVDLHGQVPVHGDIRVRAPEMFSTGMGDLRSDVYSVGVTLWALLVGRFPYDDNPLGIQAAALSGSYPSLRDEAPHVSRALAGRVRKAMHLDPSQRYQTARDMRQALTQVVVDRAWNHVNHEGHARCWVGTSGGTGAPITVCVFAGARSAGHVVETRRGANKVSAHCHSSVTSQKDLLVRLRNTFDAL